MTKIVQAMLSGVFFTFLLDFFIFLGIFQNYIREYKIDLYYNILFADNQSIILFLLLTVILGYITIYKSTKSSLIIISTLSIISLSTLITPVGNYLGKVVLMKENVKINMQRFSYRGDILYDGRETVIFYDYQLENILNLDKNKIVGDY